MFSILKNKCFVKSRNITNLTANGNSNSFYFLFLVRKHKINFQTTLICSYYPRLHVNLIHKLVIHLAKFWNQDMYFFNWFSFIPHNLIMCLWLHLLPLVIKGFEIRTHNLTLNFFLINHENISWTMSSKDRKSSK